MGVSRVCVDIDVGLLVAELAADGAAAGAAPAALASGGGEPKCELDDSGCEMRARGRLLRGATACIPRCVTAVACALCSSGVVRTKFGLYLK